MAVDQFCLKWNNFQASIISAFESLQATEDLADVTLTTEGISVKAHKIILSACSPYFRTVFKENPCSHPIVILKDVVYDDLIAVLNFMYHGEVLVTKDRLQSFLQTAEVLQVSGLIGCSDFKNQKTKTKHRELDLQQHSTKRIKITPKIKKDPLKQEIGPVDKRVVEDVRKEVTEKLNLERDKDKLDNHQLQSDINENLGCMSTMLEKPSILECVLESKDSSSILERSLLSHGTGSTSKHCNEVHQSTSELAKHLAAPRKAIENTEIDKGRNFPNRSPTFDVSNDCYGVVKVEEDSMEVSIDPSVATETVNVLRPSQEVPHHSSQCGNCPHCGKTYSNQSALKYHVRLIHSDLLNLYCCHLCPEIFDYREGYKKHMVEIHSLRN